MAVDPHRARWNSANPAHGAFLAFAVTPSDTVSFTAGQEPAALYIGGSGNVSIVTADGTDVVFQSAVAGSILPVWAARVNATGTTATGIVGLR